MKNFEYCKYTFIHRKVLVALAEKLITDEKVKKEVLKRLALHDMDKLTLYLLWNKPIASRYHLETAPHHFKNDIEKDWYTYIEACLDFASARYSKADKPLPCKETVDKYYPEKKDEFYPIMDYLGINVDNLEMDKNIKNYADLLQETVSEEDIYLEVIDYLISNEDNVYNILFRK